MMRTAANCKLYLHFNVMTVGKSFTHVQRMVMLCGWEGCYISGRKKCSSAGLVFNVTGMLCWQLPFI